jgi:hypothetical protein
MCIACELGYWAMIDALEAERAAAKKNSAIDDSDFTCDPGEKPEIQPTPLARRTVDERTS